MFVDPPLGFLLFIPDCDSRVLLTGMLLRGSKRKPERKVWKRDCQGGRVCVTYMYQNSSDKSKEPCNISLSFFFLAVSGTTVYDTYEITEEDNTPQLDYNSM